MDAANQIQRNEVVEFSDFTVFYRFLPYEYWHIIANNESIKLNIEEVFVDYMLLLRERIEVSLGKHISCFFVVVPLISPFLQSFFQSISNSLSIPIELITTATSMCLSYGFFDDDVKKTILLMDLGWDSVRLQVVFNNGNQYRMGPKTTLPSVCGKSLSEEITTTIENQIVCTVVI